MVQLLAHSCLRQSNNFPGVATCNSHAFACSVAKLCVNIRTLSSLCLGLAIHTQGASLPAGSTNSNAAAFHASSFTCVLENWSYCCGQNYLTKIVAKDKHLVKDGVLKNLDKFFGTSRVANRRAYVQTWTCFTTLGLASPRLAMPRLISPHLASFHLASPCLILPRCASPCLALLCRD